MNVKAAHTDVKGFPGSVKNSTAWCKNAPPDVPKILAVASSRESSHPQVVVR
jgi:hypothetical protein